MAQKSEQATPSPATTKQKTSLWKRRLGKGSKQSSNSNSRKSTAASASPTTVAAPLPMVAITVNGVTTAAVAAADTTEEIVKESSISAVENSPIIMDTTHQSSNYTMQDDSNAVVTPHFPSSSNHSTASYFNSIISGHRLSFSEEESTDGNGLVIQEVITTQTSFGLLESFLNVEGEAGEKWTPFGTDTDDDDVEKHVGLSSSPNEVVITTAPQQQQQESSPQQQSSQSPPEQALFQVRKVDNNHINDNGNSSPLADPPSTQRKTLTPEFFLGSGSNNKNNTKHSKKGRKRLDTSTTFNASLTTTNNHTTTTTNSMKEINNNNNNSSSNISTASSSQGGHNMYAEIYLKTKPKKKPYPPPSAVSRDRSTLSSNTNPSLDMTAVSSLSGRSSMFGTVHAQENGCCAGEHPMPVTPEGCEMDYGNGNDENGGATAAALFNNQNATSTAMEEYNYFDYDANVDAPLSPQGVSPQRQLNPLFLPNHHNGSSSSARNSRESATAAARAANWKSKVNSLWSSVSKHTCRCLGEPFSPNADERGDKWKLSSATTAATSTTAANTSTAAVVRKMNQTPMFSTPVKTAGTFD